MTEPTTNTVNQHLEPTEPRQSRRAYEPPRVELLTLRVEERLMACGKVFLGICGMMSVS